MVTPGSANVNTQTDVASLDKILDAHDTSSVGAADFAALQDYDSSASGQQSTSGGIDTTSGSSDLSSPTNDAAQAPKIDQLSDVVESGQDFLSPYPSAGDTTSGSPDGFSPTLPPGGDGSSLWNDINDQVNRIEQAAAQLGQQVFLKPAPSPSGMSNVVTFPLRGSGAAIDSYIRSLFVVSWDGASKYDQGNQAIQFFEEAIGALDPPLMQLPRYGTRFDVISQTASQCSESANSLVELAQQHTQDTRSLSGNWQGTAASGYQSVSSKTTYQLAALGKIVSGIGYVTYCAAGLVVGVRSEMFSYLSKVAQELLWTIYKMGYWQATNVHMGMPDGSGGVNIIPGLGQGDLSIDWGPGSAATAPAAAEFASQIANLQNALSQIGDMFTQLEHLLSQVSADLYTSTSSQSNPPGPAQDPGSPRLPVGPTPTSGPGPTATQPQETPNSTGGSDVSTALHQAEQSVDKALENLPGFANSPQLKQAEQAINQAIESIPGYNAPTQPGSGNPADVGDSGSQTMPGPTAPSAAPPPTTPTGGPTPSPTPPPTATPPPAATPPPSMTMPQSVPTPPSSPIGGNPNGDTTPSSVAPSPSTPPSPAMPTMPSLAPPPGVPRQPSLTVPVGNPLGGSPNSGGPSGGTTPSSSTPQPGSMPPSDPVGSTSPGGGSPASMPSPGAIPPPAMPSKPGTTPPNLPTPPGDPFGGTPTDGTNPMGGPDPTGSGTPNSMSGDLLGGSDVSSALHRAEQSVDKALENLPGFADSPALHHAEQEINQAIESVPGYNAPTLAQAAMGGHSGTDGGSVSGGTGIASTQAGHSGGGTASLTGGARSTGGGVAGSDLSIQSGAHADPNWPADTSSANQAGNGGASAVGQPAAGGSQPTGMAPMGGMTGGGAQRGGDTEHKRANYIKGELVFSVPDDELSPRAIGEQSTTRTYRN